MIEWALSASNFRSEHTIALIWQSHWNISFLYPCQDQNICSYHNLVFFPSLISNRKHLALGNHRKYDRLMINGWSLSSWPFTFMGMFDLEEDTIPLIRSARGNYIRVQTPVLYNRGSSSLYHSMTITARVIVKKFCTFQHFSVILHLNNFRVA